MEPVRKFNTHSINIVKALALAIGTCTAAGIVALEFLNGNINYLLHALPVSVI